MKVVAKTHCGKVRPINEDRYLVPEEGDSIVLVADGMGGHKAGEVASETAAQTVPSIPEVSRTAGRCAVWEAPFAPLSSATERH